MVGDDRQDGRVAFSDERSDLVVDRLRRLVRVIALFRDLASRNATSWRRPRQTGPSRSLMPYCLTILRAIEVAICRSFSTPVEASANATHSAACAPPSAAASAALSRPRTHRTANGPREGVLACDREAARDQRWSPCGPDRGARGNASPPRGRLRGRQPVSARAPGPHGLFGVAQQ